MVDVGRLPTRSKEDIQRLHENADESFRELRVRGFERICSAVAGLDSGSTWMNEHTFEVAYVNVRNWNRIDYVGNTDPIIRWREKTNG